ncbi:arginase family protein [Streptomyces sp. f51]|uniref:arginase family protein n=1 Tax=Streptomyces sp. f51 TaxID=1827742 RepID=UPI0027B95DD8|nr:arginase family protein [Streptomyces sp. f51]
MVRAGRVEPPAYEATRDPDTGIVNPDGIARYSGRLADTVGGVLGSGRFPPVLGGDCSILLGNLLALRRLGRYGLLFLDGHTHFHQPSADPAGEAASTEPALATGRGPRMLTDLEGREPWSGTRMSWPSASVTPRSPPSRACSPCRLSCTRSVRGTHPAPPVVRVLDGARFRGWSARTGPGR